MINVHGEKFLVTGGAGFIGSHICEELVNQGKQVVCVDDFSNGCIENLDPWWDTKLCSLFNSDLSVELDCDMEEIFDGVDVVFHEACSKCTVCREDPQKDLMVNAWGSFRVFDYASRVGAKVVHASTGSVYGDCVSQHESAPYAPKSFYGVSKLAGEQYLRAWSEYSGLKWVGLRYFHVYGPRQDNSDKGGVIPIFITRMVNGEPITIFGDGEQTRSFTYVKDVVNANFLAANSAGMEGEYYNVASGMSVSLNELVGVLKGITGMDCSVVYEPERQGDIKFFDVWNNKIGIGKWTQLREGLEKTIGYYHAN